MFYGAPRKDRFMEHLRLVHSRPVRVVSSRHFRANETVFSTDGVVRLARHSEAFMRAFFGKIELLSFPRNLRSFELNRPSGDVGVIMDLGGRKEVEIRLQDLWLLLQAQPEGGVGRLHVDGQANVFYVVSGSEFFSVALVWTADGWVFDVVPSTHVWPEGSRFFIL